MEPTPPAAPTTSRVWGAVAAGWRGSRRRSNSNSQAVIAVRGRAAASAALQPGGRWPTRRWSTTWRSLLQPGRLRAPAYQTASPTAKPDTASPRASTVPAQSQPSTRHAPGEGVSRRRTLASTGLMDTASTCTSRSIGPGDGSGRSRSIRQLGLSSPRLAPNPTARMAQAPRDCRSWRCRAVAWRICARGSRPAGWSRASPQASARASAAGKRSDRSVQPQPNSRAQACTLGS